MKIIEIERYKMRGTDVGLMPIEFYRDRSFNFLDEAYDTCVHQLYKNPKFN